AQIDLLQRVVGRIGGIDAVESVELGITRIGIVIVSYRYIGVGPDAAVATGDPIAAQRERAPIVELETRERAAAAHDGQIVGDALQGIGGLLLQRRGGGNVAIWIGRILNAGR